MNKFISKFNKRDKFNPYIIAEIGVNHEGSIAKAKKMIDLAKKEEQIVSNFKLIKLIC